MRGQDGKTFWERVLEALGDQGIQEDQQTVVAKYLGIRQPSVWEWARQGALPTMNNAEKLAKKLQVSTCWLLDGLGDKKPIPSDSESQRLWALWQQLLPTTRTELLAYVTFLALRDAGKAVAGEVGKGRRKVTKL